MPCSVAVLPAQQEGDVPAFCFNCFLEGEGDLVLFVVAKPPQQGFLLGLPSLLLELAIPLLLLQQLLLLGRAVGASGMPSWMKTTCCTSGLPTVRVPVLSNTTTCVLHSRQHAA
jgi:hypothetical protein